MRYNLNYRFISALNKEASVYEQSGDSAMDSIGVTEKDCVIKIENTQTWQEALIAFMECVPKISNARESKAQIPFDMWRFLQTLTSLERVLARSFAGWIANAITAISSGIRTVDNSGPWSMFLNILCSSAFKDFWEEIGQILSRYRWLNTFWQSNFEHFVNHMGTILANVFSTVLSNWGVSPSSSVYFDESLVRFFKIRLDELGTEAGDRLANLCKTLGDLNLLFEVMGATPGQREKALEDLWDQISTYIMGAGGVVLDTVGGAGNAISAFASSVANFIRNNQDAIKIGVLISAAIAAAVAAAATGGTAAPALAAAVLAFAAMLNVDLEGWTQESIQSAIERGSV